MPSSIENKMGGENFSVISMLMPGLLRADIRNFYYFARGADDIADSTTLEKQERLGLLVHLNKILEGGEEAPNWAVNYLKAIREGRTEIRHARALLSAFIQDVTKDRYENFDSLIDYCQRSAAPIGRAYLELAEEWQADTESADNLCIALQLINHLQDIKEDYKDRNRVYFPENWFSDISEIGAEAESENISEIKSKVLEEINKRIKNSQKLLSTVKGNFLRLQLSVIRASAITLSSKLAKSDILKNKVRLSLADRAKVFFRGLVYFILSAAFYINSVFVARANARSKKMGRSYSYGSSFFKPIAGMIMAKRRDMFSLHRFFRNMDNEIDEAKSLEESKEAVEFFEKEIEALYLDSSSDFTLYPKSSFTRKLIPLVRKYNLKKEYFMDSIKGQKMDVEGKMLAPSMETLDLYCYRVASTVGLLAIEIFGYKHESAKEFAINMGKGLQLINIIRDVREDAKKGRIYLPIEELRDKNIEKIMPDEILAEEFAAEIGQVQKSLSKRAREFIKKAEENLHIEDRENMRPALWMKDIYMSYLNVMDDKGFGASESDVKKGLVKAILFR